jgi:hypothetical protein
MKKIILLNLIIVNATIANAQIQFGIKGGINGGAPVGQIHLMDKFGEQDNNTLTQPQNDSLNPSYQSEIGFQLGMVANIPISKNGFYSKRGRKRRFVSFQPEALLSFQNYSVRGLGNVSLTYINVPIQFKLSFGKSFFVDLGPYVNFLLNQDETGDHSSLLIHHSFMAIGGSTGAGYLIPSIHLGIEVRTNVGADLHNELTNHPVNINSQVDLFYMFGK